MSSRKEAIPGGALYAFAEWAPNAQVYGADIDTEILFQTDRITTYYVDQTKPETFAPLLVRKYDLIIDDGLHTPWSNFNTLNALLPRLNEGGCFVVEDITMGHLPEWRIFCALLPSDYRVQFFEVKAKKTELVCVITRGTSAKV